MHKPSKLFEIIDDDEFWHAVCQSYEEQIKLIYMSCSLIRQEQIFHSFSITDMTGFGMGMFSSKVQSFIKKASSIN